MTIDTNSVDEALMTTRAVRRRLDLTRPVDQQILLDCIDVAEQAPSGGNQGSRRWIIVRDQHIKDRLAEIYYDTFVKTADSLLNREDGWRPPSHEEFFRELRKVSCDILLPRHY